MTSQMTVWNEAQQEGPERMKTDSAMLQEQTETSSQDETASGRQAPETVRLTSEETLFFALEQALGERQRKALLKTFCRWIEAPLRDLLLSLKNPLSIEVRRIVALHNRQIERLQRRLLALSEERQSVEQKHALLIEKGASVARQAAEILQRLNLNGMGLVEISLETREKLAQRRKGLEILRKSFQKIGEQRLAIRQGRPRSFLLTPEAMWDGEGVWSGKETELELQERPLRLWASVCQENVKRKAAGLRNAVEKARVRCVENATALERAIEEEKNDLERKKRSFFSFIEGFLLPALDGLERGCVFEAELFQKLLPELRRPVADLWLRSHRKIIKATVGLCREIGMREVRAARGMPFDEEQHCAMDVDETSGLPDGTISCLLRKGYTVMGHLLRTAEVEVSRQPIPGQEEDGSNGG